MDKILTIVVPTYNMEKYLQGCLSSLLIRDNMDMLEVLIVNDGSKDRSLEIAKNFQFNYPQTFKVIDKENGNYGSCINRGLKEATGKYFKVLDADDTYNTENLNHYVQYLIKHDADLVMTDFLIRDLIENKEERVSYNLPVGIPFDFDYFARKNVPYMWMHAITHRTEKLRQIHYNQMEGISYTDKEFVFYPMSASKDVLYFPNVVYNYVIGREGQTVDDTVWIRNYWMEIKAIMKLVSLYEQHRDDVSEGGRLFMQLQLKLYISSIYEAFLRKYRRKIDYKKLKEFDDNLKNVSEEVYNLVNDVTEITDFYYIRCWREHQYKNVNSYLCKRFFHRMAYYIKNFF